MKHLEFFNYENIFSGFCYGPGCNFFFLFVGFDVFFPLPEIGFNVPKTFKFLNKEKNLYKTSCHICVLPLFLLHNLGLLCAVRLVEHSK